MRLLAALLLALASGPVLADSRPAPQWQGPLARVHVVWGDELVILQDPGGAIHERMFEVARLEARGQRLRIAGSCASACTFYLGVSTTCVEPGAMMMFHGPSLAQGQIPPADYDEVARAMASFYPPALRDWFLAPGPHRFEDRWLRGDEVIAMGARSCAAGAKGA